MKNIVVNKKNNERQSQEDDTDALRDTKNKTRRVSYCFSRDNNISSAPSKCWSWRLAIEPCDSTV